MWYMDCYSWHAMCGRDFPVNSYYSETLECLIEGANRVLHNGQSGIDEIRISKETRGQSPIPMYFQTPGEPELYVPK